MFNFFKKEIQEYSVLKIYMVVDLEAAKIFETKKCIDICLKFLHDNFCIPNIFDLNYGYKVWNDFKKFKLEKIKLSNDEIVSLSAFCSSSKSRFSISNDILNGKDILLSYINITVVLDRPFLNSNLVLNLINEINDLLEIDYAYGLELSDEYDFDTEKKIKKSFFGNSASISITADDINLEKRKIEFKNGYVQKIYQFNLLNNFQLKSFLVNQNIEKRIGSLSKFNDKLFCWVLNNDDFMKLKK